MNKLQTDGLIIPSRIWESTHVRLSKQFDVPVSFR